MIVGFIVASLVFVGPLSHMLLRLVPEPPAPPEPEAPPAYYGPSRRLFEVAQALS
jgi:hypothetical protein